MRQLRDHFKTLWRHTLNKSLFFYAIKYREICISHFVKSGSWAKRLILSTFAFQLWIMNSTWEWGNPIDKAPQTNPDSRPRSAPALDLLSRAASNVGVMLPLQRSQHRKQFRRRVEHKKNCATKNNPKTQNSMRFEMHGYKKLSIIQKGYPESHQKQKTFLSKGQ